MQPQSLDAEYRCSSALYLWLLSYFSGDKICVVLFFTPKTVKTVPGIPFKRLMLTKRPPYKNRLAQALYCS